MILTFGPLEDAPLPGSKVERYLTRPTPVFINGHLFREMPEGEISDGMSFPRWQLTWDDPWHPRYKAPAYLHDHLLRLRAEGDARLKKWEIDWLFEGALRSQGVSALEAWIFTNAVRTRR